MLVSAARNLCRNPFVLQCAFRPSFIYTRHVETLPPFAKMGREHVRTMARYEGEMPELKEKEFVILTPEVSGPGGMSVPAELGEVCELFVKEGEFVKEDAVVAVIDTCKASVEARCRASGTVKKVLSKVGDVVFELHPLYIVESG